MDLFSRLHILTSGCYRWSRLQVTFRSYRCLMLSNKTTRWRVTCSQIQFELWHWSQTPDSTWNVGQTRISVCSHMTPRWQIESHLGFKRFSETSEKSFVILNESTLLDGTSSWLVSAPARAGRWGAAGAVVCRRMTVCLRGGASE